MLKSYQQFLNENKAEEVPQRFKEFVDEMIEHRDNINNKSFSGIVNQYSGVERDQTDIEQVVKGLETDYSDLNLENLIEKHNDYIESKLRYTGFIDITLNHFNKKYILGGVTIQDDIDSLIKYLYGWHHNMYGKMAILEEFDTMEDYYKWVERGLVPFDIYAIDGEERDYKVIDNIIIGKSSKYGSDNPLDNYNSPRVNSKLESDAKVYLSNNTDHFIVLLLFPYSNHRQIKPEDRERYIVDKLIENGEEGYLSVFDFDTSHVDDEHIKKLSGVSKTMDKYNI